MGEDHELSTELPLLIFEPNNGQLIIFGGVRAYDANEGRYTIYAEVVALHFDIADPLSFSSFSILKSEGWDKVIDDIRHSTQDSRRVRSICTGSKDRKISPRQYEPIFMVCAE